MNSVVEITDMLGVDYYYVSVSFERNALLLEKPRGLFAKNIKSRIKLSEIKDVSVMNQKGVDTLSFFYDRNWYTFIDYGNHIVSSLKRNLMFI